MNKIKLGILIFAVFLLNGCDHQYVNYDYLITHPKVLERAFSRCQNQNTETCQIVQIAMRDFVSLVDERNEDPEQFGQKIIMIQQELVRLSDRLKEAVKEKQQPDKISEIQNQYNEEQKKLSQFYAVISLSSPE